MVECQGKLTLHLHMVLWIGNSLTPQEIWDRIMDEDSMFQKKMVEYLEDIHMVDFWLDHIKMYSRRSIIVWFKMNMIIRQKQCLYLLLLSTAWIAGARILKILSMTFYLGPTSTHVKEVQRNSERNLKEIKRMQRKSLVQLQGVKVINGVNVKHDSLAKCLSRQWLIL